MGFEHLIHEMTTKPGDFAVSWVVLLTLVVMSAMSRYWTVINIFRATRLKSAADRVVSLFWDTPNAQDAIRAMEEQPASEPFSKIAPTLPGRLPTTSALKAAPPAAWVRT